MFLPNSCSFQYSTHCSPQNFRIAVTHRLLQSLVEIYYTIDSDLIGSMYIVTGNNVTVWSLSVFSHLCTFRNYNGKGQLGMEMLSCDNEPN